MEDKKELSLAVQSSELTLSSNIRVDASELNREGGLGAVLESSRKRVAEFRVEQAEKKRKVQEAKEEKEKAARLDGDGNIVLRSVNKLYSTGAARYF